MLRRSEILVISILYVDDERALLGITKTYLEGSGEIHVDTASSAHEGLQKLHSGTYDAVVSDYQMPVTDGIAFLKRVHELYPALPFIIFTGRGREDIAVEAFEEGADYYIQKGGAPGVLFAELAQKIKSVVEKRKVLESLAESRRVLDTLIKNLPGMAYRCEIDPDWTMHFVSEGCEALTGYTPEDLIDNRTISYGGLIVREDKETVWEIIKTSVDTKKPFTLEYRITDRAGKLHWVKEQGTGVRNEKDELVAVEGFVMDISESKFIEESLRTANRKLHLLSSITRHDILNQLMALKGFLELSKEYLNKPDYLIKYIEKEQRAAVNIERQILFTRDYQDVGVKNPTWQDIKESLNKAMTSLHTDGIHLQCTCPDVEVYADPLFEKMFYNLIDNALKYGGKKMTTISLSARESDNGLIIVCADDGVGITDEDRARLFERGFGKNTGLGLFLSREILAITGITITETGKFGEGARFEITVPKGAYRFKSPA
ncbi:MAG: response regulator [Methanoregula sp.]|nr:response regulator [Methanoregula sp.]